MGELFRRILKKVEDGKWALTLHAVEQIEERGLQSWQVVGLTPEGRLLKEDSTAQPRPKIELEITLADGTPAKAVWSEDVVLDRALLVTVHFFDR